jgi:UPF0755 protein
MRFKLLKIMLVLLLIGGFGVALDMLLFMTTPLSLKEPVVYEFRPGASMSTMARDLHRQGIVYRPAYLSIYTRITGKARQLKAGEYPIEPGTTPYQLVGDMVKGKVRQYSLTLVEGWTFWQMMEHIEQSELLEHRLRGLSDAQIMEKIGHPGEHPEGRFYPDTYHFPKGLDDVQILQRAYSEMQRRLLQAWQQRSVGLPFETPYEALILASIVEKESALPSERTRIAGVFINRLRKGMRLQTDPTVIYGLGKNFDGDIRFRDLRGDTPYNTYTRKGLPPTPIAMPGQGAIDAVMHPDSTEYLYFVARGDESGSHVFSETLEQHQAAVDKYQRKRRSK